MINTRVLFPMMALAFGIYCGAQISRGIPKALPVHAEDRAALRYMVDAASSGRPVQVCKVYRP